MLGDGHVLWFGHVVGRRSLLVSRSNGGSRRFRRFFTLDNHPFSVRLEGFIGVTDGFK